MKYNKMDFSIFYSWQSDAPDKTNRKFIRDALDDAVNEIALDAEIVQSPQVVSGMERVPGMPDVAQMMFDRIDNSDLFLGDVTLVGTITRFQDDRDEKRTPNPNVMTELGYAAARMGWERIICVMNENYGPREDLPFDVRSKRHPIDYKLNTSQKKPERRNIRKNLTKWIKTAIITCMDSEHEGINDAISRLDILCLLVCQVYRNVPYFRDLGQDDVNRNRFQNFINVQGFRTAIYRLLDLKLLKTDAHSQKYAYHWTHRGQLLLKELKKRNQIEPVQEAVYQPIDGEDIVGEPQPLSGQ